MDISNLTLAELLQLNKDVVNRVHELKATKVKSFKIGDKVSFPYQKRVIPAKVIKISAKTIKVQALPQEGDSPDFIYLTFNVSPDFLTLL